MCEVNAGYLGNMPTHNSRRTIIFSVTLHVRQSCSPKVDSRIHNIIYILPVLSYNVENLGVAWGQGYVPPKQNNQYLKWGKMFERGLLNGNKNSACRINNLKYRAKYPNNLAATPGYLYNTFNSQCNLRFTVSSSYAILDMDKVLLAAFITFFRLGMWSNFIWQSSK